MSIDRQRLYDLAEDFFNLNGNAVMKMSSDAAIKVCLSAGKRGLLVCRIEGGIWHDLGFEARLDAIWDGVDPPVALKRALENNLAAAEFIRAEKVAHDAFILSVVPITG
jgi:hypothetical protein